MYFYSSSYPKTPVNEKQSFPQKTYASLAAAPYELSRAFQNHHPELGSVLALSRVRHWPLTLPQTPSGRCWAGGHHAPCPWGCQHSQHGTDCSRIPKSLLIQHPESSPGWDEQGPSLLAWSFLLCFISTRFNEENFIKQCLHGGRVTKHPHSFPRSPLPWCHSWTLGMALDAVV